ncbi:hypothetical protein [Methanosarcina horonobensis]|uniref:hypothetical protein n=1 Tax=Methanosarcina horonobensis TaxID=418008 RepID=UPI000AF90498|nr:hypothetical protein [Methanosarcina horonobensis]
MKILVNALGYGIFIELNPEDQKKVILRFMGLRNLLLRKTDMKSQGSIFILFSEL